MVLSERWSRAGCINGAQAAEQHPSGAKAQILPGSYGTAEAVPFQDPVYATSFSPLRDKLSYGERVHADARYDKRPSGAESSDQPYRTRTAE